MMTCDVAVVGAGACGMTAALTAARAGARVLLLEKQPTPGGNCRLSTGLIPAAGTDLQRAAGIADTPEKLAADICAKNGWRSDPAITDKLCQESAALVHWLMYDTGLRMHLVTEFLFPGMHTHRMHMADAGYGDALADHLHGCVAGQTGLTLHCDSPVRGLLTEGGRVTGVRAVLGGQETGIRAGAVVLGADGFGANPEWVRRYLPDLAAAPYCGSPGNTGDGIAWGVGLGAAVDHMGACQGHGAYSLTGAQPVSWALVAGGAVLVNRRGERFADESTGYSGFAVPVLRQPDQQAFMLFDQQLLDQTQLARVEVLTRAGLVMTAASPEALAGLCGIEAAGLQATVAAYNRSAVSGDDPFGRRFDRPLQPPYCGVAVSGVLFHTQGGLRVNTDAQVLRPDGSPIPGLYAGGGTAAGISGDGVHGYLGGNGLLAALGLGRIAAQHITRG